jgi:GGDEF domain-containing protein
MINLRVIIALSNALARARLRATCRQEEGLEIVGEAANGAQVAALARDVHPDVIMCDERVLVDPDMDFYARFRAGKPGVIIAVIVPNPDAFIYRGEVRVGAVFSTEAPIHPVREHLARLVAGISRREETAAPAPQVMGMETRFTVSDARTHTPAQPAAETKLLQPIPGPTTSLERSAAGAAHTLDIPERRQSSEARDSLQALISMVQATLEDQRDPETGLPNSKVLGKVLSTLAEVAYPAAVVVVRLWFAGADGTVVTPPTAVAAMRSASAALRANVRQPDVLCRLDKASFAVLLPGVLPETAAEPSDRIRSALLRVRRKYTDSSASLIAATGVGFWAPPMQPIEALQLAWKDMVAGVQTRKLRGSAAP